MTEVGVEALKEHPVEYLRRAWGLVETGAAVWNGGKPMGSSRRPRVRGRSAAAVVLEDRGRGIRSEQVRRTLGQG